VLIDFGSRALAPEDRLTSPNERVGTPYYMSRRQIDGQDRRTLRSVNSLGVILYEMSRGRVPYAGHTVREILDQHRTAAVRSCRSGASRYSRSSIDCGEAPGDPLASADQLIDAMKELTQRRRPPEA